MASDNEGPKTEKGAEILRKLIGAGIGAAFMTEEHIKKYISDMKLPKEAVNFLLQGAAKSKEELVYRVGTEVIKIINRIDFVEEASRFVEEHKFKVSAEIEVLKKDGSTELKVSTNKSTSNS